VYIIQTVVVTANKLKPFTHAFGPYIGGSHPKAVVNGFFVFHDDRQGALADGLHGLNPRNTEPSTPLESRTALIRRLLIPLVLRWNPSQCGKRTNSSSALGAFFVLYQLSLEREG
jgi:hypothetical protein